MLSVAGPHKMASFLPSFQLLTCKGPIRVFALSSQLVIYLTGREPWPDGRTKIVVGAAPAPFALFVCFAKDSPTSLCPVLSAAQAGLLALERDQEAEFRVAASRGRPCQIRTGFPMPARHTSHARPSCPFKLIWLKIRPQKHFILCSQVPGHTCLIILPTSHSVSFSLLTVVSALP